jgi:hypothetical protein
MVWGNAPSSAVSRQIFSSSCSVKTSQIFASAGPIWRTLSKNLARCAQRARVTLSSRPASASRFNSSRFARDNSSYDNDCCFLNMFDTLRSDTADHIPQPVAYPISLPHLFLWPLAGWRGSYSRCTRASPLVYGISDTKVDGRRGPLPEHERNPVRC